MDVGEVIISDPGGKRASSNVHAPARLCTGMPAPVFKVSSHLWRRVGEFVRGIFGTKTTHLTPPYAPCLDYGRNPGPDYDRTKPNRSFLDDDDNDVSFPPFERFIYKSLNVINSVREPSRPPQSVLGSATVL